MAIEMLTTPGGVFAVWGAPTKEDIDLILRELERANRAAGGPVLYVARVPQDAPAPDAAVRNYLTKRMHYISGLCSSYHAVMEGSGFGAAMKRGVLLTMVQVAGRRGKFFVHATVSEVLDAVPKERTHVAAQLLAAARAKRWLSLTPGAFEKAV